MLYQPKFCQTFDDCFFLIAEADINDFCKKLNWLPEEVNAFVEKNYHQTFNQLIEKNRVDYFIVLVKNAKVAQMSLDELATASGFACRHDLQRCFAQYHGGTPAEFILLHQEQ